MAPTQGLSSNRVKIAVLDTGIDEEHPYIFARDERVVERYNWLAETRRRNVTDVTDVRDNNGHGTFVTGLLLDHAPGADLYVAKISENGTPAPPRLISEASTWHFPPT